MSLLGIVRESYDNMAHVVKVAVELWVQRVRASILDDVTQKVNTFLRG